MKSKVKSAEACYVDAVRLRCSFLLDSRIQLWPLGPLKLDSPALDTYIVRMKLVHTAQKWSPFNSTD